MTIRALGIAGVGAVGLAAVGMASPAAAVTVAGCGDVPAGASATVSNGICQLDFTTPGSYSWTLPAGISGLYALVVGGGGGAYADGIDTGYSGTGGQVIYADYTSASAGSTADLTVGAGGASDSSDPTAGENSTIMLGVSTIALGGIAGGFFLPGYCVADGNFSTYVGVGDGAGGSHGADGGDCATTVGPGVNPSLGDDDSNSNPVPAAFASINSTFGLGGQVVVAPAALATDLSGTGEGASVRYVDPSTVPTFNATGGTGRVSFRYSVPAAVSPAALAATGSSLAPELGLLAGTGVLGAVLLALSRRRTRREL